MNGGKSLKYILDFELKNNITKSDYRSTFISFFKKSLENYFEGRFFDQYYGPDSKGKDLSWSVRFDKPVFKEELIELASTKVSMTLKTGDQETAYIYFSSLLNMKNVAYNIGNDNQMILKNIRLVRESDVLGNFAVFKILSPICIRLHDKKTNKDTYLSVEDADFEEELKRKLKEDMNNFGKEIDSLIFDLSKLKKIVVPVFGIKIDATIGTFFVQGSNEVLNHMKNYSLGSRRNSGFGLIEQVY